YAASCGDSTSIETISQFVLPKNVAIARYIPAEEAFRSGCEAQGTGPDCPPHPEDPAEGRADLLHRAGRAGGAVDHAVYRAGAADGARRGDHRLPRAGRA